MKIRGWRWNESHTEAIFLQGVLAGVLTVEGHLTNKEEGKKYALVNRNASLRPKQVVLGYLIYQCTCHAYILHTTLNNGNIQMGSKFPLVNFPQTLKGQEERFGFGGPKKKKRRKERERERAHIHLGMPSACLRWKKAQRDKGVEGERPGQCACAPRASF